MAQTFRRSANTVFIVTLVGLVLMVGGLIGLAYTLQSSPYVTRAFEARSQPIQFSHERHVGGNGIDCRYCHTSVETSPFAGIPPTKTCMNCHAQIFKDSPFLELVRSSFRDDRSIEWTRVHDLPDFVYFNHSIHVNKGIGCSTCHGRVDLMPLLFQARGQPGYMLARTSLHHREHHRWAQWHARVPRLSKRATRRAQEKTWPN